MKNECAISLDFQLEVKKKENQKYVQVSKKLNSFALPFRLHRKILAKGYLGKLNSQLQN